QRARAQARREDAAVRVHRRAGAGARRVSDGVEVMAARVEAHPHAMAVHAEAHGLVAWLTTVDHKRIGILYGFTAFAFLLIGGLEALFIRLQLALPGQHVVRAEFYNALFTMHGTTMIFLAVMPLNVMFFNYMIPLLIGARDVAFPRLNAFSY